MTGLVFSNEIAALDDLEKQSDSLEKDESLASKFGNKLCMVQSLYHTDLDPNNPSGALKYSSPLIRLSGFNETTTTSDLIHFFSTVGLEESKFEIIWIDNISIFVHLKIDNNDLLEILALTGTAEEVEDKTDIDMTENDSIALKLVSALTASAQEGWKFQSHRQFIHETLETASSNLTTNTEVISQASDDIKIAPPTSLKRSLDADASEEV
jgi:hypothetical protein